jgi:hypothetical protein
MAAGRTRGSHRNSTIRQNQTRQLMREAIEFHMEGMRLNGDPVPEPTPHIEEIEVAV